MFSVILAYFGPETVMPVTSVIATIAAVGMMFGRTMLRLAVGWLWLLKSRTRPQRHAPSGPHFALQHRHDHAGAALAEGHGQNVVESLRS
jgi:hypothetical protein